jgi:hypothetical protein
MASEFDDFLWVVFSGKRPEPARHVNIIKKFVTPKNFQNVSWFVAEGDRVPYMEGKASNVRELGSSVAAVNEAFRISNRSGKPVVIMADDVSGIYAVEGPPEGWQSSNGFYLHALPAACRLLTSMRAIGAKVGGVSPHMCQDMMLRQPLQSLTAFVVADFFVVDPPMRVPWVETCWPKEDYQFSADVLCRYGLLLRENRLCVSAEHYKVGGDGCGPKRRKAEIKAAKQLMYSYPGVFSKGGSEEKISLTGGLKITKLVDEPLWSAVRDLQEHLNSTRMDTESSRSFLAKAREAVKKAKAGAAHGNQGRLAIRQRVRRSRGTMPTGAKRKCGRRRGAGNAQSQTQRNRLCEARSELRDVAERVAKRRYNGEVVRLRL